MNANNLDVNNKNLFDFSRFSGLKAGGFGKFSNASGGSIDGSWVQPDGNIVHITDNGITSQIDDYPTDPNLEINFTSPTAFSVTFLHTSAPGTHTAQITNGGNKIMWYGTDGSYSGDWVRQTPVSSPAPSGIGNTVTVPVTPITPPGAGQNPTPATGPKFEQTILNFQQWANANHNEGLVEDGFAGPATAAAFEKYKTEYNTFLVGKNTHTTIWGMPAWVVYTGGGVLALTAIFLGVKFLVPAMKAKGAKVATA